MIIRSAENIQRAVPTPATDSNFDLEQSPRKCDAHEVRSKSFQFAQIGFIQFNGVRQLFFLKSKCFLKWIQYEPS